MVVGEAAGVKRSKCIRRGVSNVRERVSVTTLVWIMISPGTSDASFANPAMHVTAQDI